jgi:hypothetical protein
MAYTLDSLKDVSDVQSKALEGTRVTIVFASRGQAINYRHRCYKLRSLDRANSRKIYDIGEPGYDQTAYDSVIISLSQNAAGSWELTFEKGERTVGIIEVREG